MTYRASVMSSTPMLYLPLNETSGTSAAEYSGNSLTGTYSSAPASFYNPLVSQAFVQRDTQLFSTTRKVTGTVDLSVWSSYNIQQPFSVEGWIYAPTITGSQLIFGRSATEGLFYSTNVASFSVVTTAGTEVVYAPLPSKTRVYHIMGVYTGTDINILVNGVPANGKTLVGTLTNGSSNWQIGGTVTSGNTYISNVAVYKNAIPATVAYDHYFEGTDTHYYPAVSRISGLHFLLDDTEATIGMEIEERTEDDFLNFVSSTNLFWQNGYQQIDTTVQGQRIVQYDIGELGIVDGSRIDWNNDSGNLVIETSFDGITWNTCTNHAAITGIARGTDVTNKLLWIRQTFNVPSTGDIPLLYRLNIVIYSLKNPLSTTNSVTATIVEPVTLAEVANEPIIGDATGFCQVGISGSITIPVDADGRNTTAFELLVRKDAGTATFLTIGSATLSFAGTASGMSTYINGVLKSPASTDFPAGKWVHVYITLTTPANSTVILGQGASYMFPTKYWQNLLPQTIINHANSTFGNSTINYSEPVGIVMAETSAQAYQFAWSAT